MSDKQERKVKGYLHVEIARLKQYISDMDYEHRTELKTWTLKCGQMGNEIGSLRKHFAEIQCQEDAWTEKYGRLQKQLAENKSKLQELNADLKHAQWENLQLKQRLVKKELDYQTLIDDTINQVKTVRQLIQDKNQEIELQAAVAAETDWKLNDCLKTDVPISTEIMDLASDVAENKNLCKNSVPGQINESEADRIVMTYCSSESEMDGEKNVSNSVESNELVEENQTDLPGSITEKVQHDQDTKQKVKFHFWNTLKQRVSMKGKPVTPPTPKVSESDL